MDLFPERIEVGQRVRVCEGSWLGRVGSVADVVYRDAHSVLVIFDDDAENVVPVVACTLEHLPDDEDV